MNAMIFFMLVLLKVDLLTPSEVMALLRISRSTLYSWVAREAIPFVKLASTENQERGLLRFPRVRLLDWIAKRGRGEKDGQE